jgi:hypothetical protein
MGAWVGQSLCQQALNQSAHWLRRARNYDSVFAARPVSIVPDVRDASHVSRPNGSGDLKMVGESESR